MQATAIPNPPITRKLAHIARDIKLSHTVFAMPFALLGMFLAAASGGSEGTLRAISGGPAWGEAGLIVLCMVFARTFAMTVNRWADAKIDAANPRTAGRAIPSGRLSRGFVFLVAVVCAGLFWLSAAGFYAFYQNPWPAILAPLVLLIVGSYSFMKRFTWLCHVFLGVALASSPVAAAIAVEPSYLGRPDIWLLFGMVLCWVAGFDIIYALQDVEADREHGIYSMPSRLGVEPALWISRLLHLAVIGLLITLWQLSPALHTAFPIAIALTAGLLLLEHTLIIRSPQRHLNMAFFTLNGVISVLLGAAGILDVLLFT